MSNYKADTIVIGAGAVGLAIAEILSKSGREVLIYVHFMVSSGITRNVFARSKLPNSNLRAMQAYETCLYPKQA